MTLLQCCGGTAPVARETSVDINTQVHIHLASYRSNHKMHNYVRTEIHLFYLRHQKYPIKHIPIPNITGYIGLLCLNNQPIVII